MNKEAIKLQKEVVKFLNAISELMLSNDWAVVGDLKLTKMLTVEYLYLWLLSP